MSSAGRTVGVVTGSRADFGLLRPVIEAIDEHPHLERRLVVVGSHLLPPEPTVDEVAATFEIDARIPMQTPEDTSRLGDARAVGRGVSGIADWIGRSTPDVVLVLGDRIEAFAAATAASVAGVHVAHLHGGDRAEGIADEALRHAITKLAHLHLPATASSAERIICLGEEAFRVHLVGSPAIDDLDDIPPLDDEEYDRLGQPAVVFLLHPAGLDPDDEWANADRALRICQRAGNTVALHPNHDPGRGAILDAIDQSGVPAIAHLPRHRFVGLLRRATVIVGNSSAGLVECAALPLRCINLGRRQQGRDKPPQVVDIADWDFGALDMTLEEAFARKLPPFRHPYGDGQAGRKTAEVLATFDAERCNLRKCCSF